MPQSRDQDPNKQKRLRTACDICHHAKMKCSGGAPCNGCRDSGYDCFYSVSNRIGRPKGTKNKRTLERMGKNVVDTVAKDRGHKSFQTSQDLDAQPSPLNFACNTHIRSNNDPHFMDSTSIDTMLGTEGSFFMGNLNSFPDDLSSWHNLNSSTPFALPKQSSFDSCYDSEILPNDSLPNYPHDDSAYVSPSSLFSDQSTFCVGTDFRGHFSSDSNVTTSTSSSSLTSWGGCNCMQNHAEVVCRVQELEPMHTARGLDSILSGVQQALVPWKEIIDCRVCQHDDNQELLIHSASLIRIIFHIMSAICHDHFNSPSRNVRNLSVQLTQGPIDTKSASSLRGNVRDEGMAATDLSIWGTLNRVKYTLSCFKDRLEATKAKNMATAIPLIHNSTVPWQAGNDVDIPFNRLRNDLAHLMQLWQDLERTFQMLERGVNNGITAFFRALTHALRLCDKADIDLQSQVYDHPGFGFLVGSRLHSG